MTEVATHIEALLFLAGEAVEKTELLQLTALSDEAALDACLQELESALDGHGLSLLRTDTKVQLVTAPSCSEFLARFQASEEEQLSKAATETLAIIAYRGPIARYDIDLVRGVDSRAMLRQLTRRGLIIRLPSKTRVPLYDISEEFLQHMGIPSRSDLPEYATLSNHERIAALLDQDAS